MNREELIKEIREMIVMLNCNSGILYHYQFDLLDYTLKKCLIYLGENNEKN